ncbi:MAG TPA: TetR/AcrR family transcriptional regulator [Pseudonocardia sp.]|jgi:AcrR family transcriptional regulator
MATERADAARNRARVLVAAAELFRSKDPRTVTMDDVAKGAGVGRATLYRRYPDVVSIAAALLGEYEYTLQERMLAGPPPLGPGAVPAERLAAFYAAMVEHLEQNLPLHLGVDAGAARLAIDTYGFWRAHVRSLITANGTVDDPDALVDALIAPLAAEVYQYQRTRLGLTPERIVAGLTLLAQRILS